jgi:hypothetical protein
MCGALIVLPYYIILGSSKLERSARSHSSYIHIDRRVRKNYTQRVLNFDSCQLRSPIQETKRVVVAPFLWHTNYKLQIAPT